MIVKATLLSNISLVKSIFVQCTQLFLQIDPWTRSENHLKDVFDCRPAVYWHSALDWRRTKRQPTLQNSKRWSEPVIIHVFARCLNENVTTTMLWRMSFVKEDIDLQRCRRYHVGTRLGIVWSGLTLHSPVCWERAPSFLHFNNKQTRVYFTLCFVSTHAWYRHCFNCPLW